MLHDVVTQMVNSGALQPQTRTMQATCHLLWTYMMSAQSTKPTDHVKRKENVRCVERKIGIEPE